MAETTRILAVDDEPTTLQLVEYLLQRAGYEVVTATDGAEGLARVEEVLPHLIVSDVVMPRLDGLEMCRRVRLIPGYELVPFLFLSARQQVADRVEGLETGADDFIAKPFGREELLARVEAALRRAQAWQRLVRTDRLTQLGNREAFEARLQEELYRGQRYGTIASLALVAIDLDELGVVQRERGSAAADHLIRHVGWFLRDNVRTLDVPVRYGDGGFIVLMPHTEQEGAVVAIERLAARLKAETVAVGGEALPVRASFGIAVVEDALEAMTSMLRRAQASMMAARREGGGQVHVWRPGDGGEEGEDDGEGPDRR